MHTRLHMSLTYMGLNICVIISLKIYFHEDPKNYRVPRFLESLRAIMTDEGLVSFECKVIGYPTPELSWFKDGNQLQPGDVYELTGSKSLGIWLHFVIIMFHFIIAQLKIFNGC